MGLFRRPLTQGRIDELVDEAQALADEGAFDRALEVSKPLRQALSTNESAARGVVRLLRGWAFDEARSSELAAEILKAYPSSLELVSALGRAAEAMRDMRYLNDAPALGSVIETIGHRLVELLEGADDPEDRDRLSDALGTTGRLLGRAWDDTTERAYLEQTKLHPDSSNAFYNLGLFYKTRGRFAEGQAANEKAFALCGDEVNEGVLWNLGICATGAGDGERALPLWTSIGQKIEMGRFDLPEGGYPTVKVRLAAFPLAERGVEQDAEGPGQEETIWIERLSPCHGIVRSALYYDIGVDYGDVVLFDGAAITFHEVGDRRVPVFPHLATLVRPGYQIYRFVGLQGQSRQLGALSETLPLDAVVYSHTENFRHICRVCWEGGAEGHDHDDEETEHQVVEGKVCAPPELTPAAFLKALDAACLESPGAELVVPDLCRAAGDEARAEWEESRWAALAEDR